MPCCGCEDIWTQHAPLIHPAADIQFILNYMNGGNPASITDIDRRNVQAALESYFSQTGIPIKHELPAGAKNNLNLDYETQFEFIPGTLEVVLSGISLNGNQADPRKDFVVAAGNKGFTILLEPNDPDRLNSPPRQFETLFVNYRKRITFNTIGGT